MNACQNATFVALAVWFSLYPLWSTQALDGYLLKSGNMSARSSQILLCQHVQLRSPGQCTNSSNKATGIEWPVHCTLLLLETRACPFLPLTSERLWLWWLCQHPDQASWWHLDQYLQHRRSQWEVTNIQYELCDWCVIWFDCHCQTPATQNKRISKTP